MAEVAKGALIKNYTQGAIAAYDRILTVYPLESRAKDAEKRLEALKATIPKPTPQAIAADKAQIASRGKIGTYGKVMENFHKGPDVSEAAKTGEPTLVDPKQASAPEMVRNATDIAKNALEGNYRITVETVKDGATTAPNEPAPHSDSAAADDHATAGGATSDGSAATAPAAGSDMQNDLPASGDASAAAPMPPPTQVNDLANTNPSGSTPAASSSPQQAPPTNTDTESSSKKKKKKKLLVF
jgi:hypothetical protein